MSPLARLSEMPLDRAQRQRLQTKLWAGTHSTLAKACHAKHCLAVLKWWRSLVILTNTGAALVVNVLYCDSTTTHAISILKLRLENSVQMEGIRLHHQCSAPAIICIFSVNIPIDIMMAQTSVQTMRTMKWAMITAHINGSQASK